MNLDPSEGHPAMDYPEHIGTYRGFIRGMFWGSILVALAVIVLAITTL
jgi:Bacterial aa3 type cytochrome c oxidase subunit IV